MNNRKEHTKANLKIVPYYVIKNPSEPSLIGSLTSCISLVPASLSRISQSIQILITMNEKDITSDAKAIT